MPNVVQKFDFIFLHDSHLLLVSIIQLASKMEDWIAVDGSFVTFKGQGRIFVREMRLVPGKGKSQSAVMTAKNSSNRFVNTKFCLFNLLFRRVIKYCSH